MNKYFVFCVLCLCTLLFSSCSKDDDPVPPSGGVVDPDKNVPDPVGTVTLNMMVGDDGKWVDVNGFGSIRINSAYNFDGSHEFVSLGQMKGLGNVTSIPQDGWNRTVAVNPGEGYVARTGSWYDNYMHYTYARLYVVSEIAGVTGGVIGYKVKCQAPFELPLKLQENSLTFGADDDLVKELTFTTMTSATVESCPDWCDVVPIETGFKVTATPNLTGKEYTGTIVLKNSVGTASVTVKQKGMDNPKFVSGRGTAEAPWVISTPASLDEVRNYPSACYELGNDIDLSSYLGSNTTGWKPIDNFSGKFDGKKHTIKGLWISLNSMDKVGLFSSISSAESIISNLSVVLDTKGVAGQSFVGGLCGEANGRIENCMVNGDVTGQNYVGGLAGSSVYNARLDIVQCATSGTVTAQNYMGGIMGDNYSANVQNCYSTEYITVIPGWYEPRVYGISSSAKTCYYAGKIVAGEAQLIYIYPVANAFTGCYYNSDRNAYEWNAYSVAASTPGLTTAQMMKQSSYQGWDFDNVWTIDEGSSYPQLRSLQ